MELLSELAQRKALIAAALLFALGAGVLGQTILEYMAPPTAPPAATTEFVVDEEFTEETGGRAAAERPATPTAIPFIVAYVSGAVRAPDVYRLPGGARIKDLVLAAGGFADDADIERINLAAPIADGQHVRVPWIRDATAAAEITPAESPKGGTLAACWI